MPPFINTLYHLFVNKSSGNMSKAVFLDKTRAMLYNDYAMNNIKSLRETGRLKALLEHYEYGKMPPKPKHLTVKKSVSDRYFAGGKAELIDAELTIELENEKVYTMAVRCALPQGRNNCPAFIHIKDNLNMPDKHQPTEEICDSGFAVISVGVDGLATEIRERSRGLARALRGSERRLDACGSLAIFAWCAMRAVDYLYAIGRTDCSRIATVGHGIYGTAALLAAAYDSRISVAISNSAGPSGTAKRELVVGELFELKCHRPNLFCKRFYKMSGRESEIPFDSDALLHLIAPRRVLLDNADDVLSRCAEAELCSAISASKYYESAGASRLSMPDNAAPRDVLSGDKEICYMDGDLAYRRRGGLPYLSREDWQIYMKFISGGAR